MAGSCEHNINLSVSMIGQGFLERLLVRKFTDAKIEKKLEILSALFCG
jgi:hypothetical protein